MTSTFPDPNVYDFPEWVLYGEYFYKADDIISFGNELTAENVREAYRKGIFPWFEDKLPLWWSPDPRFVLFPEQLKVSKSMHQVLKSNLFQFKSNTSFEKVIHNCKIPGQYKPNLFYKK